MIEKAKQENRYGVNSKLATAAKIREMLLSDEFLDALAKRISYKSGIWVPKVGDKVKVNRPGRIADGKVGVIVEDDAAEYVVRVDSENLTSRNLKCEDLEPAWAETANPSGSLAGKQGYFDDADGVWVDEPNPFDGRKIETANPSHVEGVWVEEADANARKIEPNETSDVSIPDPGPGYRLLSKDPPEPVVKGDEFFADYKWLESGGRVHADGLQGSYYYRRKIEQSAKAPEPQYREPTNDDFGKMAEFRDGENREWIKLYFVAVLPPGDCRFCAEDEDGTRAAWRFSRIKEEAETIARYDSEGRNVTELAGLWTEGDTQYREPTYADLANGPIEVEVCYDNTLETSWGKRMLYAVLPANVILRFVCEDPDVPESIYRWKHARVRVR